MKEYTRREIFSVPGTVFVQFALWVPALCATVKPCRAEQLDWQALVDRVGAAAEEVSRTSIWNQVSYVDRIAKLAQGLQYQTIPWPERTSRGPRGFPSITEARHSVAFQISLISFDEGEIIPPHDHPQMTGVLTCATGQLSIDEYDIEESLSGGEAIVRLDRSGDLTAGMTSTLTSNKRNIHAVHAKLRSQVVDIFTPPYDERRTMQTKWFEIEPHPGAKNGTRCHARPYKW